MSEEKLIVKSIVVHELKKNKHEEAIKLDLAKELLDKKDSKIIGFIKSLLSVYGKKENSAQYGIFENNTKSTFPNTFHNYFEQDEFDEGELLNLSVSTMYQLKKTIHDGGKQSASGGYILFVDYEYQNNRFLMIVMLKNQIGVSIKKLTIEELEHVDLKNFSQAARINFNKYQEYNDANQSDKKEISYLSFVSKLSQKKATGYFIEALGCTKGNSSSKDTNYLISEIQKFFAKNDALKEYAVNAKNDIHDYLLKCVTSKETAKLSNAIDVAKKYFPQDDEEKLEELTDSLYKILNDDPVCIPFEFPPHLATLNSFKRLKYKSEKWEIDIDKSYIGINENYEVYFDAESESLTFTNIPEDLKNKIILDLKERKIIS